MKKLQSIFSLKGKPYMNNKMYLSMSTENHLYTMTPDTYILKAAEILGMSYSEVINTRLKDHHSYSYIEEAAQKGSLTIPILDYDTNSQDGLHRAMWAKEKGFKHIPVLIYGKQK